MAGIIPFHQNSDTYWICWRHLELYTPTDVFVSSKKWNGVRVVRTLMINILLLLPYFY